MPSKHCPMCHTASEDRAWQCRKCGYEFGQNVETVQILLRSQRTNARITLGVLAILDLGALGALIYSLLHGFVVFSGLGFVMLALWTFRALPKLSITTESLRQIDRRVLPKATVHKASASEE